MNAIGIALLWCVVQVTLIGLLAAGLYLVVRRMKPAAAGSVVSTGLGIVVVLSLFMLSPWPRWKISPLPTNLRSVPGEGQGVRAEVTDNSPLRAPTQSVGREEGQGERAADDVVISQTAAPTPLALLWQSLIDELSKPETLAAANAWHWPEITAVLLLSAMACGLVWLLLGLAAVRWQRIRSRPIHDRGLLELVDVLCAELGCRRPVEVRESADLATAATVGWRRPAVLLPADWTRWTPEVRRAVLAHEIAHARGQDFIALLVGQLGLSLHFYHPLLHWLIGRLRLEQELAADAAAASVSGGQQSYLMTIAELALRRQSRPMLWPARSFLPTQTTFLRRIAMLRDSKLRFDRLSPVTKAITIGVVLLCGLLVAGLRGPGAANLALAADTEKPTTAAAAAEDNSIDSERPTAAAAAADNSIDTTYMIENASLMCVLRPAAIFAKPELAELAKLLEQPGNRLPKGTQFADFRQITILVPKAKVLSGLQEVAVYQWIKPNAKEEFNKLLRGRQGAIKDINGKKMFVPSQGGGIIMFFDENTAIQAGSESAMEVYLASKRGVLPKWMPEKAWESFQGDHIFWAADPRMMREEIPRQMKHAPPYAQAVFGAVSTIWQDSAYLAAGAKLGDKLSVHAQAATNTAESSEKLLRTADAMKMLVQSAVKNTRTTVQSSEQPGSAVILPLLEMADGLLENMKSQRVENEVRVETSVAFNRVTFALLLSHVGVARQSARRVQSANNMKQLALAMHGYLSANKRFPPAVHYGPDGKTKYSWRVALLPFLEWQGLYDQYRFDEPWDGPNNIKLLDKMPAVFRNPNEPADSKFSSYYALVGPGAIFDTLPKKYPQGMGGMGLLGEPPDAMPAALPGMEGMGRMPMVPALPGRAKDTPTGTGLAEIGDGCSNTLLLVEAKRDIPWTKPEDIPYDPDKPLPKLGGYYEGAFLVALADGAVRFIPDTINDNLLRIMITKDDRQPVDIEKVLPREETPRPKVQDQRSKDQGSRPKDQGSNQAPKRSASPWGGKYTASALLVVKIQDKAIFATLPSDIPKKDRERFEIYKATQKASLLSPFVLLMALKNPKLSKLPSVQQAIADDNAVNWLRNNLKVNFPNKAEVMEVSFTGPDAEETVVIVNVVVDTYLAEVVDVEKNQKRSRLKELDEAIAEKSAEPDKNDDLLNLLKIMTAERDKLKAELRVPPRVMLLSRADVPEKPSSLW
jgi:beta-lactamase regulating signal transducer with metallopeptidase domain